jgi:hypothetical protein
VRVNLRVTAEDAGWTVREAAWSFEERVLWRGGDAARAALERASRAIRPLQRLVQTRLTWPLSDELRTRSARTRAVLATSAATLALAAGGAGALIAADHSSPGAPQQAAAPLLDRPVSAGTEVLQGATPRFEPGQAPVPLQPPAKPSAPPAQVAFRFAQAFVGYEVGQSGKKVDQVFAETATKQLAKALAADPPRLPANGKVPQARVLNVVLRAAAKNQMTASVSLVRLRAISELRLTLSKTGDQWRVAQVLG